MKHLTRHGVVIALVLLLLAACAGPRTASLTIFHTNDIHAHHERRGKSVGAAEVAGVIAHERETNAAVLVLDAGDIISGMPVSSLSKGRAPFTVMARMGYDAAVLGNHEFDHGWRSIAGYRELAPFPLLCANAFGPDGHMLADAPSETFEFGPLRVGVVGVIAGDALEHTVREGNEGVWILPPEKILPGVVEKLREDAHLVIVLSHCGIDVDRRLAREVAGIDLIVGGHSHTTLAEPERIGDTWIVQAGCYLRNLGRLRITYDLHERKVLELKGELLRPDAPVHPDVAAVVQDIERDIAPRLDRVIGKTTAPVKKRDLQKTVERIYEERLGADMAYHNPGGIRATLEAGPITVRMIWEVLPFENTLVKLSLRGAEIPDGWRSRLGGEVDPDRVYVIATNSYVGQHLKRYLGREDVPVEDTKIGMREAVLEAVEKAGGLTSPRPSPDKDLWYALYLDGNKSGWMHTRTTTRTVDGQTHHVTAAQTSISLARGPSKMTITTLEETEENAAGQVVRFSSTQDMGFSKKTTTGVLKPDGALEIDESGRKRTVPYPEGAIGPVATERLMLDNPLAPGREYRYRPFAAEFLGQEAESVSVVVAREDIDVLGRRRTLWRVKTTMSVLPDFPMTTWTDDTGNVPVMEMKVPMLGTMRMVQTEEALAKRAGEPAEVFMASLLSPDRAIPEPRKLKRAVYRLSPLEGKLGNLVSGVGQTSTRDEDGRLRVVIDATPPSGKERFKLPYAGKDMASFLAPSALLESDDARVIALAKEAVGDETDPIAAGKAIESFVRKRIDKKNLDIGFASAAEVAKHLEGDCTEHGVLCAAMARAVGIPARVVMGLVYLAPGGGIGGTTGVFGYHMWAEVYVGGNEWLPIDAAIGAMDATHIALARSDLAKVNPVVDMTLPTLSFMGNLKIEVIEPLNSPAVKR